MFTQEQLNRLYRYALSLTGNESLSYDLLQDAIVKHLDKKHPPGKVAECYLRTCIRNRYIDQLRHEQRFPKESLEPSEDSLICMNMPDPGSTLINQEQLTLLLEHLNPLERELLHLWAYEEMTAQEIADQLDSPRGTILSRIHRLRKKLAQFDLEHAVSLGSAPA